MVLPNPTIDPPHLPAPAKRIAHSRSPSLSPTREYRSARHLDPLLRDLSPTTTLRAFTARPDDELSGHLSKSVEHASHAQRSLGTQAAQSCLSLRSWTRELESWEWPGTFDMPEPARKRQRTSAMSLGSMMSGSSLGHDGDESESGPEYWGSLPALTVQVHQDRIETISDGLDEINVDELKDFVLSAHSRAGYGEASFHDSIGTIGADTNLKHLDDFTALVTATILQSLPYLSRLHRLLDTWTTRLDILRNASKYIRDLVQAQMDLDHGWAALAVSNHPAASTALQQANATFSLETMTEMKMVIGRQVNSLGRRLDNFLNMLEGREEYVPDIWIEDFETLEEQYGRWVVQAERKVLEAEWSASVAPKDGHADPCEPMQRGPRHGEMEIAESHGSGDMQHVTTSLPSVITTMSKAQPLSTATDTSTHTTSSGPRTITVSTTRPLSTTTIRTLVDEPKTGSDGFAQVTSTTTTTTSPKRVDHQSVALGDQGTAGVHNPPQAGETTQAVQDDIESSTTPTRPSIKSSNSGNTSKSNVKKRAAFLNGDIEKSESLNKSKPAPIVRPFEHASNAFTRLFKRDKDNEFGAPRSSSVGSKSSTKRTELTAASLSTQDSNTKLGYADLFTVPTSRPFDSAGKLIDEDENPRQNIKKVDPRVLEYVDMVGVQGRASPERSRSFSRPRTSRATSDSSQRPRSLSTRSPRSSKQNITALPPLDAAVDRPASTSIGKSQIPATYMPTGLSSPFHSPIEKGPDFVFPENWPLSNEVTPTRELEDPISYRTGALDDTENDVAERRSSKNEKMPASGWNDGAIGTDAFEDLFVASISGASMRQAVSGINAADERETRFKPFTTSRETAPLTSLPDDELFYQDRPAADRPWQQTGRDCEIVRVSDSLESNLPRPVSMVTEADDEESAEEYRARTSQTSTVVDHEAANAAFPAESSIEGPPSMSKRSLPSLLLRSKSTPPVSPMLLRLRIPDSEPPEEPSSLLTAEEDGALGLIRRASSTSIEAFPRSKVRSIEVVRNNNTDSPRSLPQTPQDDLKPSIEKGRRNDKTDDTASPLHYKGEVYFPSPPVSPPSVPLRISSKRNSAEKRRSMDSPRSIDINELTNRLSRPRERSSPSPIKSKKALQPGEDNIDRHVSEVLDRVHANINFRTRAGAETPQPYLRAGAGAKLPKVAERQGKSMTLAPASSSSQKSNVGENEVKLYHLTQTGRAEPIKLYVRLVGENERVMVRVGGGWEDLADYLRQYAEHHGSRTVSEGGLELQTATSATNSASASGGKRTFSGPASAYSKARIAPTTPLSGTPVLDRPGTANSWLEQSTFAMGDSDESGSPSPSAARQARAPQSAASSRPTTANADRPSSSLRQVESAENSPPASLSMAGPGSSGRMKAGLEDQKARWVEGMIEKVNKSASAEKNRALADMGKVGSTRRLALRQSSTGQGG